MSSNSKNKTRSKKKKIPQPEPEINQVSIDYDTVFFKHPMLDKYILICELYQN